MGCSQRPFMLESISDRRELTSSFPMIFSGSGNTISYTKSQMSPCIKKSVQMSMLMSNHFLVMRLPPVIVRSQMTTPGRAVGMTA